MRKSVWIFLGLTFGGGYVLMFGMQFLHLITFNNPSLYQNLLLGVIFFVPALSAVAAAQFEAEPRQLPNRVWPVPLAPALQISVALPVIFLLYNMVCWVFGWTELQWRMGTLTQATGKIAEQFLQQPVDASSAVVPVTLLVAYPLLSVIAGATYFAAIALGSEYGWRGFLLPRLQGMGKIWAYSIVGVLSAAWFFPLIFGWYQETETLPDMWSFMIRFTVIAILFSVLLGEIWTAIGSTGLCAIALGGFMSQLQSIWDYLFPRATPPWTGPFGVIAIILWLMITIVFLRVWRPHVFRMRREGTWIVQQRG